MQITRDSLNVTFPASIEPLQYLDSIGVVLPRGSQLLTYENGSFATFSHNAEDVRHLVRFVRRYFLMAFRIVPDADFIILRQEALGSKKGVSPLVSERQLPGQVRRNWLDRIRHKFFGSKDF